MKTIEIIVTGRVQGVGFRYMTYRKAIELGLHGYVKNLPDGSVRIVASGTDHQFEQLLAWCRTHPGRSLVEGLDLTEMEPLEFTGFSIR